MRSRILAASMDLFCFYRGRCLQGMQFWIFRSRQHHSLYYKFPFQYSSCLDHILRDFVECTRTLTSLGHFGKVGPLFKRNIMSPY